MKNNVSILGKYKENASTNHEGNETNRALFSKFLSKDAKQVKNVELNRMSLCFHLSISYCP